MPSSFSRILPLIGLLLSFSALADPERPELSTQSAWRLPDGTFTEPPAEARVSADAGLVAPRAEGTPAFLLPFAVAAGDVVSVSLRLEAQATAADEGAEGQASLVLTMLPRDSRTNYNPNAEHRQIVIIGSAAENIQFAFRAKADHSASGLALIPTLSYFGRTLLLSEISFTNHGPEADPTALTAAGASYPGHEPDAAWREKAATMIDRHRKADLRVVVTDRLGHPLPETRVSVEQLRHAYPFGTAVVSSRIVDAPRVFSPESGMTTEQWLADNARYRDELLRNFNTVVTENDLKWPQWAYSNETHGIYHQTWTLQALDWLRRHDFINKGHTLIWGSWRFSPTWLRELEGDPEALHQAILTHIRDTGDATADHTHYWDVLNEPMSHRTLIRLLGMEKVAEWFQVAREVLPQTRLIMNEFDLVGNGGNAQRRADFINFYRELADLGAPINGIGFQGHFWSERFTAPEDVWAIIDEVHTATGLPIMISEFDSNVPNEQLQADYTRDFLTAWFAHPATEAFIMWGFWGGAHWMGDAGAMYRRDWSEKPNLAAYRNLVYGDWWTREDATTAPDGTATIRAFLGRHQVKVTHPNGLIVKRVINLDRGGRTLHIVVHEKEPFVSGQSSRNLSPSPGREGP